MKKIMIVDDEINLVESLRAVLESEGFEVISVLSGQECIDKLKKIKPDLIIMDMMMSGMSGRETVQKIRENNETKHIKIIFLTVAKFSELGESKLKELNVLDYINKPFDNNDLIKRIKEALKK